MENYGQKVGMLIAYLIPKYTNNLIKSTISYAHQLKDLSHMMSHQLRAKNRLNGIAKSRTKSISMLKQGYKGIRLWPINDYTQNFPFCTLQLVVKTFRLNEPTNQNQMKVPKVVKPTNKKTLF